MTAIPKEKMNLWELRRASCFIVHVFLPDAFQILLQALNFVPSFSGMPRILRFSGTLMNPHFLKERHNLLYSSNLSEVLYASVRYVGECCRI
jgi:hypothetical protein